MALITGKPIKAFLYQDHESHIVVHMAAAQDPKIQKLLAMSPNAQVIQSTLAAHIQEHMAFEYRRQIELKSGVPFPAPNEEMDETMEIEISRLAAAAAEKVLASNQAEAQQQQQAEQAQDPIIQMQQKELEIKAKEVEIKEKKLQMEAAAKQDQIDTERGKAQAQGTLESQRQQIEAAKDADKLELERDKLELQREKIALEAGIKLATEEANRTAKQQEAGVRMGMEIARDQMNRAESFMQDSDAKKPEGGNQGNDRT
jgi:hypothetical protein